MGIGTKECMFMFYLSRYTLFIKKFRSETYFIIPVNRKSIKFKILKIFHILKFGADTLIIEPCEVK